MYNNNNLIENKLVLESEISSFSLKTFYTLYDQIVA